MIVHGVSLSPFVRKVLCVLEEKGLAYENRDLAPFPKSEEVLAMNPLGKIPIFEDGDFTVPDSSVICAYLERKYPEPALYPRNDEDLARVHWFEEYADTRLAESILPIFFERFVRPRVFREDPQEDRVQKALTEVLPETLDYLERSLGDQEFLVGGAFTLADIAVCSMIVNLRIGGEDIDAERHPRLADHRTRVLSRPSFEKLISQLSRFGSHPQI